MVYYRKYRPQTISELDSSKVRETLYAVFSRPEIPHAFLLTGPKGLGKTSTARIIAKVVNCLHTESTLDARSKRLEKEVVGSLKIDKKVLQHPDSNIKSQASSVHNQASSIEPDNTCEQCISITNGSNMDVLEIDGASNRGIDEIRDLRDKAKLAPSRAKKKVYIIDEVHMLTTEAFNALLKTIEEPPSHVLFIFCTTEPQKVPETILSRCFHVAYARATEDDVVRSFTRIVEGEKLDIDTDALHEIARLADGGFRDGTKILEELVALSAGKRITKELVEEKYHTTSIHHHVTSFLEAIAKRDVKTCLSITQQLVEEGVEIKYFISQVLEALHDMLLRQVGVTSSKSYSSLILSIEEIQTLASLFSRAYQETKYAIMPQLPLELVVVTWCTVDTKATEKSTESTDNVIARQSASGGRSGTTKQSEDRVIPGPLRSEASSDQESSRSELVSESSDGSRIPSASLGVQPESSPRGASTSGMTIDSLLKKEKNLKVQSILRGSEQQSNKEPKKEHPSSQEEISDKEASKQFMENLIYKIKPINFSIAGVLRGCTVKKFSPEEIIFETMYSFHKDKLVEAKTQDILEKAIQEITGKKAKVMIELTKESKI